jgi:hypothetical protein
MAANALAANEAMITLTAPTDRRSGIANALLNIGFLPALAMSTVPRDRSEIGTAVCYRIVDSETKGHFRDIIVDDPGLCTVGMRGKTNVAGSQMALRASRHVLQFGT